MFELLASRMSPIELPVSNEETGNRITIEPRRKATPIKDPSLPNPATTIVSTQMSVVKARKGRKDRGVSRYRTASMAARFRIAWREP
jgi:hypothetical protein